MVLKQVGGGPLKRWQRDISTHGAKSRWNVEYMWLICEVGVGVMHPNKLQWSGVVERNRARDIMDAGATGDYLLVVGWIASTLFK